jgi:uncharacterized protein (TIGR00106 family)
MLLGNLLKNSVFVGALDNQNNERIKFVSVVVDFSIFPIDKGISVSPYVAEALQIIKKSKLTYQLGPMGTCIEGDWNDVMEVIQQCFENLKQQSDRIYMTIKVDYRKGHSGRIAGKIKSVEKKI